MMSKKISLLQGEIDLGDIIHTIQIAHITFCITETLLPDGPIYHVYTETQDEGVQPVQEYLDYNNALTVLGEEIRRFEAILEHKRKGIPTQKQLHFLFREKIPISSTLTWGEASDLIDERLSQIAKEKQTKRLDRFNSFIVGDRVSWVGWFDKKTRTGHITKLTQAGKNRYAYIAFDDGLTLRTQSFGEIRKIT